MKTLIEKSIIIHSIPTARTTIFNLEDGEVRDIRCIDLTKLRKIDIPISFTYEDDGSEHMDDIIVTIPEELETENEIKQFILDEINNKINII